MSFEPFEITAAIDDFINPGLKKENRKKSGAENLEQMNCSRGVCAKVAWLTELTWNNPALSIQLLI